MPRLVIVDPSLRRRTGHHFNYAVALRDAAKARGLDFAAFGFASVDADVSSELPVRSAFRVETYQMLQNAHLNKSSMDGIKAHEASTAVALAAYFLDDLRQVEAQLLPDDILFFHTLSAAQFLGLAQWAATGPTLATLKPSIVALLRFWHPVPSLVAPIYGLAATALKALPVKTRITADTIELAIAYGEMTGCPVDCVPIPHTHEDSLPPAAPRGEPLIGYLGHARGEKGSHFIADVVTAVAAACPGARFVVQIPPDTEPGDTAARMRTLQHGFPGRITLAESNLSRDDYNRHMARSHIVLLSYDPGSYKYRSSGVFIEAAAAGKVAVVPARSSMFTEAQRFGVPVVAFDAFTPQAVAQATIEAVTTVDHLLAKAPPASRAILAHHNADRLLDYLLA